MGKTTRCRLGEICMCSRHANIKLCVCTCSVDEMVSMLSNLICMLPGKEACAALCVVLDLYAGARQFLREQGLSL